MADYNNNRLRELGGSDFEMQDGEPDIRGWDVKGENGKHIGEVEDLLFDPATRKVRYLIVDLEDNDLDLDDRTVLVPVGVAQLHEVDDDVLLPGVTAAQLASFPEYDKDNFTTEHEHGIRHALTGTPVSSDATVRPASQEELDFYDHEHFNEDNLYRNRSQRDHTATNKDGGTIPVVREELEIGKRDVETGGVRLRSRVREEEVSENINLREESVNVERVPVNRDASEGDLRERDVEMRERNEVPVVNKEARVVEEVSLRKDVTERDETIRDTVRNTEIDVDKNDNRNNDRTGLDPDRDRRTDEGRL